MKIIKIKTKTKVSKNDFIFKTTYWIYGDLKKSSEYVKQIRLKCLKENRQEELLVVNILDKDAKTPNTVKEWEVFVTYIKQTIIVDIETGNILKRKDFN